jgi:uncharacterized protein (DUF2235 family)
VKNIVICCDGTNNQLHGDLTNVVRLYEIALKDEEQVAFYDPGVGTMPDPLEKSRLRKAWSLVKGLAFGAGLDDNVMEAYRYLMGVYEDGDRIFLFGFSRGAFCVRVLAGMLHAVGLLHSGAENLLPYIWKAYRRIRSLPPDASEAERNAADDLEAELALLRRSFSRRCPIAFLGPWDTVGSVGLYNWNQSFAYTFENSSVQIVRHAVSLDERRAAFRSNVFKADDSLLANGRPRVMNVWFPGVHSDIGGGYPWPESSGLAMLAFQWMVREAVEAGLRIDEAKYQALLAKCPPDAAGPIHDSLQGGWWIIEYLPARRYDWQQEKTVWRWQPNKPRTMLPKQLPYVHQSVLDHMAATSNYRPESLPPNHDFPVEITHPWPPLPVQPA